MIYKEEKRDLFTLPRDYILAVQSNVIRGLTKDQYSVLKEMCACSNNLYNVALYNIRQHFFRKTGLPRIVYQQKWNCYQC